MTRRAVSISLKIPDNEAYTALVALRRLGVDVESVERSEIFVFDEAGDADALVAQITADERIFNPNKHRLSVLDSPKPRWGEVWIEPLCHPERVTLSGVERRRATQDPIGERYATSWRLFAPRGTPVKRHVLEAAIDRLLCNPAIDRAVTSMDAHDRDNPFEGE
jgi:phosphoribosylformylglycinamidine (FGAM) synthase PurS component